MELPLTRNIRPDKIPPTLSEYEQTGGYRAVQKALKQMTPADVTKTVKESNLMLFEDFEQYLGLQHRPQEPRQGGLAHADHPFDGDVHA